MTILLFRPAQCSDQRVCRYSVTGLEKKLDLIYNGVSRKTFKSGNWY